MPTAHCWTIEHWCGLLCWQLLICPGLGQGPVRFYCSVGWKLWWKLPVMKKIEWHPWLSWSYTDLITFHFWIKRIISEGKWIHLVHFSHFFKRRQVFLCVFLYTKPLWRISLIIITGGNLLIKENSFSLRADILWQGRQNHLWQTCLPGKCFHILKPILRIDKSVDKFLTLCQPIWLFKICFIPNK